MHGLTTLSIMIALCVSVLIIFLGIREIIPKRLEMESLIKPGEKEIKHYHGNRLLGTLMILFGIVLMISIAVIVGWIHLPNLFP